jgi:hypothetical protein
MHERMDPSKKRGERKKKRVWSDLDSGEGALAAAVAEDAVEVERVQVAPHRAAALGGLLPPSLSLSAALDGQRGGFGDGLAF